MKTQSTTKGFAILSAAGMAVKMLSLLYVPFLQIIIGGEGYGVYASTYAVFAFVYIITNSGLSSAISKIVSELIALENYKDAVKAFKMARFLMIMIGTFMAVLLVLLARPLANVTNYPKAYLAIMSLAPAIVLTSVASAYRGYFQGRGNMKPTAVSQILEQIANLIFSLIFAALLMKYGVEAGCAGATVGTTIGALVSVIYLIRFYSRNKVFKVSKTYSKEKIIRYSNKELFRKVIYYATPLTVAWGAQNAGNLIDAGNTKGRLLAAGFSDEEGSTRFGYLGTNQVLIGVPITLVSALCTAVLPSISKAAALDNKEDVHSGVEYAFKACFFIALPSAVGLAVLSQPIFNLLFSKNLAAAYLMKYYAFIMILMAIVQIQTTILQSIGKLYISTFYIIIGIFAKIFINYILIAIPSINILGAVVGSLVGFLIPLFLNNYFIKKSLGIKYNLIKLGVKPFIASVFMGLVVYLVNFDFNYMFSFLGSGYKTRAISTFVSIGTGGLVYLYALILVGGITKKDLNSLPNKILKMIPKKLLDRVR
ncbi:polysaccharide biosynthesis protein [Clostridium sp. SYSU_GA19001]|uniref:putative polysaccharide biosynthesis protein n=1 Tax=Clostridium caldaquaticum TaxID=2940653 RepID=UPI00207733F5|nr:polysaccharide biosynthesis protein [Clostridium caldaquaticum]MCM8711331.1 polysaccharide biosynthesis protein [Clostridium caldaquaticum]